ncbi:MAG: hypothetical protein JJ974_09880 [Phycisphaerales bacterium]|nr:hypothetical protein [Phycisphaerales bacterium]
MYEPEHHRYSNPYWQDGFDVGYMNGLAQGSSAEDQNEDQDDVLEDYNEDDPSQCPQAAAYHRPRTRAAEAYMLRELDHRDPEQAEMYRNIHVRGFKNRVRRGF